jgi:alkylation response protein AidB-like acyl-CoA dehydrogenase
MDFELTREQKAIQKAAWQFAQGKFDKDYALECELNHRYPSEAHRKACELGLFGVHFPEEYGGQGYGLLENVLVIEALCRKDPGLGMTITSCQFGSQFIVKFGTEEQKREILPKVAAGEWIMGAAFTEPDHGSDITDMNTTAVREGDEYVVNGVKTFITNGLNAQAIVYLVKTDPNATPAYRGLSNVLIETSRAGFEATDVGHKMGLRMQTTAEIALKGVRIPAGNLIGQENRGFHQSLAFFDETRIDVAAKALGAAQGAFDRALDYAKQREQFGRRLADYQAIQHKIAEMATKIETARLMVYRAAWTHDNRGPDPKLASMAKMHAARIAVEVADEAVQIFGGYGYLTENEVERIYRDVRVTEIYEGTREVQKNVIASYIIGKNR